MDKYFSKDIKSIYKQCSRFICLYALIIALCVMLCSCHLDGKKEDEKHVDNYEVCNITYLDENEIRNYIVDISYPTVRGLKNNDVEQIINEQIKRTAFSVLDWFTSIDEMEVKVSYSIECSSDKILSIHFLTFAFHTAQSYPLICSLSSNFIVETGQKIGLPDMILIDDLFMTSFYDNFKLCREYISVEAKKVIEEDVKNTFVLDDLYLSDTGSNPEVSCYITEDSIVISIAVRYASGSYVLYDAKLCDIQGFFKPNVIELLFDKEPKISINEFGCTSLLCR